MINECAHRLKILTDKGLTLCQLRSGDYSTNPENHDLTAMVERIAKEKSEDEESENSRVVLTSCERAGIYVDRSSADTLLRFLIDNALRYCRPNTDVSVSITTHDNDVRLTLTAMARHILPINPFADFVPRMSGGQLVGADFGLALARELMQELDGTLDVASSETDLEARSYEVRLRMATVRSS